MTSDEGIIIAPKALAPGSEQPRYFFSICTLVTDWNQYRRCIESFERTGFRKDNSQILFVDNSQGNRFDGYSGIREFVRSSNARYVVVCHQDVELVDDGFEELVARLGELDRLDPNWAIAGNSGLRGLFGIAMRISDPIVRNARIGNLPMRVDALDENFLIIKACTLVVPSHDLSGFHFYGLDLCIQARTQGFTSYVIDFHLKHHSRGSRSVSFFSARDALEKKYAKLAGGRIVRTTCALVFLGWCYSLRFLRSALVLLILGGIKAGLIAHGDTKIQWRGRNRSRCPDDGPGELDTT